MGIVESGRWLEDRARFLRDELARTTEPARREAIEQELARVDEELASRRRRRRRWWIIGGPVSRD